MERIRYQMKRIRYQSQMIRYQMEKDEYVMGLTCSATLTMMMGGQMMKRRMTDVFMSLCYAYLIQDRLMLLFILYRAMQIGDFFVLFM